jgi:hypothetical protein
MNNYYARMSLSLAGGAVAGLLQTLIIVALSNLAIFQALGMPFKIPFTLPYLYQRITWGGLWGLLFLIPLFTSWRNTNRGLIFALVPACASLFYFLPYQDNMGWFGLGMGTLWPGVVVIFAVLWGYIAGVWLDRAYGLVKED